MVVRKLVSALLLTSFAPIALGLQGCGGSTGNNAASSFVKAPELPESDQEARCKLRKSQADPLIVEWPNGARGRLESAVGKKTLVAIKYSGCELEQLPGCTVKSSVGSYAYWPITRKQSRVVMRNSDELFANMPVGAVQLEGKLKTAGQLEVAMTIVGRYEAPTRTIYQNDLEGECSGATHVIAALSTGSFTFSAGGDAEVGGGVSVGPAGGGAKSTAKRETLQSDGDEAACARASSSDKGPPEGCGALLQIEVASIQNGNRPPPPAPPPPVVVAPPVPAPEPPPVAEKPAPKKPIKCKKGEKLVEGECVKAGKKPAKSPTKPAAVAVATLTCNPGQHKEGTRCVDDPPPAPVEPPPEPAPKPITECASGMRLEGDRCVAGDEPPPAPAPSIERKSTPTTYDAETHPTEQPNPWRVTLAYVGLGAGLLALSSGLIALKAAGTVNDGCDDATKTCTKDADDAKGLAVGAAVVADVSLGVAALAFITMWILPSTVKVGAAPTKNGATVGARWSW